MLRVKLYQRLSYDKVLGYLIRWKRARWISLQIFGVFGYFTVSSFCALASPVLTGPEFQQLDRAAKTRRARAENPHFRRARLSASPRVSRARKVHRVLSGRFFPAPAFRPV